MGSVVGGAFLGAFLQVFFDRLASREVVEFIRGRKINEEILFELRTVVGTMSSVVDDAEEKQITNSAVKNWLDDLKDAAFEADDLLGEIDYRAPKSKLKAGFWRQKVIDFFSSRNPFKSKLDVEVRLEKVLDRLRTLARQTDHLGLREGRGEKPPSNRIPTTCLVDESQVYGRDDDKKTIMRLLEVGVIDEGSTSELGVIPIVGMGGIGKTTLAKVVFNDVAVREWFDVKAWVYVSEESDVVKMTRNILEELSGSCDMKSLNQLQHQLHKELEEKRFLLVLDDVWTDNKDVWDALWSPFKSVARGSKVIVTTRHESVGKAICTVPIHHLQELSEDSCWSLFEKCAFRDGICSADANPDLEEVGRAIVRKCKGLPLAAKALGGLLRTEREVKYWEKILRSNLWDLPNDNILPALRLSYHYLPSSLKRCFAYCAIFPKDYEFEREEMAQLWMAEGFVIQTSEAKEMEEVAGEYFDELVSRSFYQRSNSHRSCFVMHDLLNELAKDVSGEFCLIMEGDESRKITNRTRHLSFAIPDCDVSKESASIHEARWLRTFLLVEWSSIDNEAMQDLLRKHKRLRVLSLSQYRSVAKLPDSIGCLKYLRYLKLSTASISSLPETICDLYNLQTLILRECKCLAVLPDSIGDLRQLRYLDLHGTAIEKLPKSFSNLCDLQTLILCQCKDLMELPTDMRKLTNLCHLDIRGTNLKEIPPQIGNLKKLQTLTDFVLQSHSGSGIKELGHLQQLNGSLCIRNLNVVNYRDALDANLKGKRGLKELELRWEVSTDEADEQVLEGLQPHTSISSLSISGFGGTRFPSWVGHISFKSIGSLKLNGCKYCTSLPPLGQLVSLSELSLIDFDRVATVGEEFFGENKNPFESLKVLKFERMPRWKKWMFRSHQDEGNLPFPQLQELCIRECPELIEGLPENLPSLTALEIEGCAKLLISFPKSPNLVKMKFKDNVHDVQLQKLPSGMHSLTVDRFHSLHSLLQGIERMGCFPTTLQDFEVLNNYSIPELQLEQFPRLKSLRISRCSNLQTLFTTRTDCMSLTSLEIRECPNLAPFPEGRLPAPNLTRLMLLGFPKVESFPDDTLLPSTLTNLKLWDFKNLKTLNNNGLQNLTSLKDLEICNCPKLEGIPEEGLPPSLSSLTINLCPLLERRCQREVGDDWHKISRIPHLRISFRNLQQEKFRGIRCLH